MIPRSKAVMQATTDTTLNSSPDRKEAAGKNTKWNRKLRGPLRMPHRGDSKELKDRCFLSDPRACVLLNIVGNKCLGLERIGVEL